MGVYGTTAFGGRTDIAQDRADVRF